MQVVLHKTVGRDAGVTKALRWFGWRLWSCSLCTLSIC